MFRPRTIRGTVRAAAAALTVVTVAAVGAGTAHADLETGNLPGGTGLTVSIDTPADSSVMPAGPVQVSGTASVGQAEAVQNTAIIYVLDVSGSTGGPGCGGNPNGDASSNTILDCEIAAGLALNDDAVTNMTVGEVGVVAFGSTAAAADVDPSTAAGLLTGPATDANSNSSRDVEEVLKSAHIGALTQFTTHVVSTATDFRAAVTQANLVAAASSMPNKIVVFMSDGFSTGTGSAVTEVGNAPAGTTYQTFAVGGGASCTNAGSQGSLAAIATAGGGTCTEVPTVADLPGVVPGVIEATLDSLQIQVNGGTWDPVTPDAPATLPATGPAGVTYTHDLGTLGAGVYTICVKATGSDVGGSGSVTDCHQIVLYDPSAGFVTGGGRIDSPAGALAADPSLSGTATFGFVSKYQKGAATPTGQTEFQFKAGSFNFHSDAYNWLVVAGARAQYKGTGSVNGVGGYSFMLTATDGAITGGGGVDRFRIKVWDGSGVVYDNGLGASDGVDPEAITAGSIVIHS